MDYRLKRRSDFERVFKKGKRRYTKNLIFVYVKARDLKVGYSVSKKNGNAVRRNRIKRILRAAMREYIKDIAGFYHIVIIPQKDAEITFAQSKDEISYALKKENLFND